MEPEYKQVYKGESWGTYGHFGIQVLISQSRELTQEDSWDIQQAMEVGVNAIKVRTIMQNPKHQQSIKEDREDLLALFPCPIYVEQVPNEYSNVAWTSPWFKVTTPVGHIKVGWRKRVINIDWSETIIKKTGKEMFPDHAGTIDNNYLHADSYEEAKQCIDILLANKQ